MRLKGKVALIFGGSVGIGAATARVLVREGAKVAIMDIDERGGLALTKSLNSKVKNSLFIEGDVTDEAAVSSAVRTAVNTFGALHIVHNNAGGSSKFDNGVTEAPLDEFWDKMKIDLFGTWLGCRYGIPAIIKSGGGSVINMSSMFALVGTKRKDCYTAAKGAITAITRSMAVEYAEKGVRVNAIAPGATGTERVLRLLEEDGVTKKSLEAQLFGIIAPEDIANAVLFMASDESRQITGQILSVDGGMTIH